VISSDFSPDNWKPERTATDWAVIVLRDALSIRPVSVKTIPRDQFATVSNSGSVLQIGYGEERRYLPSVVRDCRVRKARMTVHFFFGASQILDMWVHQFWPKSMAPPH
jgi:hypothetical protein